MDAGASGAVEDFDDPAFVTRLRRKDAAALKSVATAYLPHALRAAAASGVAAGQVEDVVQATFITFIEKIGEFEGRSRVRTWLFGILYRKILELGREVQRDRRSEELTDLNEGRFKADGAWARPPKPVDMEVYDREIGKHIADCLDRVPERQRAVFVLREVESLETAEICGILSITAQNAGVLIHRARNQLRDCLEAKGIGV